ncbi:uncharacterized protein SPSC_01481 [Sporisorium scitamineum]|uniref:RRM domain-containing protein n=1 Tax=Sporisorium scitamineum TaxID=49012 RepID=A0A0F7S987_9BASI|nr:uncharacterized protein SPSC_01481 [Sporisorium scitamineum]CDW97258.1 hypothetical protein [Sporisorium scitamineum]
MALPDGTNGGSRPPFGRQSFSDGPSISAANLLSADLAPTSMDACSGSFSGSFTTIDPVSPLPQHPSPLAAGLSDPLLPNANSTASAPTTGPLSASDPRTQLLVSNLPYRVRWQDLKDLFRKAGTVLRADVSLSPDNRSRGYGTVLMATEQDAIKAADMLGGFTWQGRTLDVRVDRSGTLVGVAGSAVLPTIASNGTGSRATPSPNPFGNGALAPNANAFAFDPTAGGQQFLGLPVGSLNGSQGHSPGSLSGATSPSPLSPLARAADYSQSSSTRASFSAHPDASLAGSNSQGSELERAILQGQGLSGASGSGSGTPNRPRPGSNFDAGGFSGQAQHRAVSAVQSLASSSVGSRRGSDVGSVTGSSSPLSAVWSSSINDAAAGMYSQNAGGSSVPTGFPGAAAIAPWPAGPGSFGGQVISSMQSQPFPSHVPTTSYAGRVLFVGNLPFHCQWQDLKDLFRAAGNIQRADVAIGPDGRSRGFGTVLFATQEDAQNAVRVYHGYEYSGRTLKVHFDRFAAQNGPAVGTPGNPAQYTGAFAAAALPSHMTNNIRAPSVASPMHGQAMQGGFGQQQYPHQSMQQQQQQRNNALVSFGMAQQQGHASFGHAAFQQQYPASHQFSSPYQQPTLQQEQQQHRFGQLSQHPNQMVSSFSAFADAGRSLQATSSHQPSSGLGSSLDDVRQQSEGGASGSGSDRPGSTAAKPFGIFSEPDDVEEATASLSSRGDDDYEGMSIMLPANGFGAASSYLPSDLMSPGLVTPAAPTQSTNAHPGRIQLPSTNFANSFGAALAGAPADQMSPMTARMQVPMTPGMPGFTFHQVPQTPPLYPQFLSPGLGPFSPTVGGSSQVGGPEGAGQNAGTGMTGNNMNAGSSVPYNVPVALTPGAPIGYNPMFSTAASYGQQQPATPHWSQTSWPRRGGGGRAPMRQSMGAYNPEADEMVESNRAGIAKTPGAGPRWPSNAEVGGAKLPSRRASDGTPDAVEPSQTDGYPFPLVAAGNMSHLTRRASTNSPAQTPLAGPAGSTSSTKPDSAPISVPPSELLTTTSTEELANTIARLSVKGTALARESNSRRSLSMTAERSAAASAMAKLREKAGTPTPPGQVEAGSDGSAAGGLGAAFGESQPPTRLGLAGRIGSNGSVGTNKSSPLAQSWQQDDGKQELFGLSLSSSALEAARNGSALDTEDGGSGGGKSVKDEGA